MNVRQIKTWIIDTVVKYINFLEYLKHNINLFLFNFVTNENIARSIQLK